MYNLFRISVQESAVVLFPNKRKYIGIGYQQKWVTNIDIKNPKIQKSNIMHSY